MDDQESRGGLTDEVMVAAHAKRMLHSRDEARGVHCGDVRGPQAHQFGMLRVSGYTVP